MSESPISALSLAAKIEAMLFVAPEPATVQQLAAALEVRTDLVDAALKELDQSLAGRGLRLQRHAGRVQMTTAPELAPLVERFLGLEATTRLSRAALETLAIVAYRQPVTRPQIDSIRGINSDSMMRSLLNKGLIQESGRTEGPGRPIIYSTSAEFLQHFGMDSLAALPPFAMPDSSAGGHDEMLKG